MSETSSNKPIVIFGPTAGGKSALAVALAEKLGGQIIGADSMQIYRHMDAGTAKPTPAQRTQVPHHLIDIVEPTDSFSVHDWLQLAEQTITTIAAAGQQPIVVGGTNLYLKALLEGLLEGPSADATLREAMSQLSGKQLHDRLQEIDPQAAKQIHINDIKRLMRAIEVYELTGNRISEMQQQWDEQANADDVAKRFTLIGLRWETPEINSRINLRVKAMFYPEKVDEQLAADVCIGGESLPDEVVRLKAEGKFGEQSAQALGYKQVLSALDGRMSMDDAFEQTKVQTRRFAKNQRTWLKRFPGISWIDVSDATQPESVLAEASRIVAIHV